MTAHGTFVMDMDAIRKRAREHLEKGSVTDGYGGSADESVAILNEALATEIVCILRYKAHAARAVGINSESVKDEFLTHAREEEEHADMIAERINQLGGDPDYNPETLLSRSASEYAKGEELVDMIREDLVAERIAIDTYREMIRYFSGFDPTTRRMLEEILAKEEEHAQDMHDLLVAHEGSPMLSD